MLKRIILFLLVTVLSCQSDETAVHGQAKILGDQSLIGSVQNIELEVRGTGRQEDNYKQAALYLNEVEKSYNAPVVSIEKSGGCLNYEDPGYEDDCDFISQPILSTPRYRILSGLLRSRVKKSFLDYSYEDALAELTKSSIDQNFGDVQLKRDIWYQLLPTPKYVLRNQLTHESLLDKDALNMKEGVLASRYIDTNEFQKKTRWLALNEFERNDKTIRKVVLIELRKNFSVSIEESKELKKVALRYKVLFYDEI